jgi:hypothetical protein
MRRNIFETERLTEEGEAKKQIPIRRDELKQELQLITNLEDIFFSFTKDGLAFPNFVSIRLQKK